MNNDNIVKIGTALKWRSVFDMNKRYYQENIVSMCGSVFRCKILFSQGQPPVGVIDEVGHIAYINPDVWDVVVGMADYYNYIIDCKDVVEDVDKRIQQNANNIQSNKNEIEKIKQDDLKQWGAINKTNDDFTIHIQEFKQFLHDHKMIHDLLNNKIININNNIARVDNCNEEQQKQIDYLFKRLGYSAAGLWDNDVLWDNEGYWENYPLFMPYFECIEQFDKVDQALNDLYDSIANMLLDELEEVYSELAELISKHDEQQTIIDAQKQHIAEIDECNRTQQEQIDKLLAQDDSMIGYWNNETLWDNDNYWENGPYVVVIGCVDCNIKFEEVNNKLKELTSKYNAQQTIINKQQTQIEQLLEALNVN